MKQYFENRREEREKRVGGFNGGKGRNIIVVFELIGVIHGKKACQRQLVTALIGYFGGVFRRRMWRWLL